jgi:hypothetical protein
MLYLQFDLDQDLNLKRIQKINTYLDESVELKYSLNLIESVTLLGHPPGRSLGENRRTTCDKK